MAERIIGEELQRLGWSRADLEKWNRSSPVVLASFGIVGVGDATLLAAVRGEIGFSWLELFVRVCQTRTKDEGQVSQ